MTDEAEEEKYKRLGIRKYPEKVPVETKKEKTSVKPTKIRLEVDIPGDTGVDAIVKQDITGDGKPDNTQKISTKEFFLLSHDGVNSPEILSYDLWGDNPN
jgi:hypothetical protein